MSLSVQKASQSTILVKAVNKTSLFFTAAVKTVRRPFFFCDQPYFLFVFDGYFLKHYELLVVAVFFALYCVVFGR